MGRMNPAPAEVSVGSTPAALAEARRQRKMRQSEDTRKGLQVIEARLVELGLVNPDDPVVACPFAVAVVAAYQRHFDTPPSVGLIRAVANERRAEYELPLLPEPEEVA